VDHGIEVASTEHSPEVGGESSGFLASIVAFEVDERDERCYSTDALIRVAALNDELGDAGSNIVVEGGEL
jgi:hypothetical protein